jgi:L-ascorbate metabolism protein UlaG (beta-lactamase superfamily)
MIVTYLGHSGFLIETEKLYLLFDSIAAEEITPRMQNHPFSYGIMPQLDPAKEILVFVSHAHQDHFSRRIWKLRELYPHVKYFLSSDIDLAPVCEAGYISGPYDPAIFITGPGQTYHPVLETGCDLLIETLPSTDEGVAFFLTLDGVTIYHAGDLHAWCWDPVPEGEEDEELVKFLDYTKPIHGRKADVAFLPLDPRLEIFPYTGMDQYLQMLDVSYAFPMHFWKDYDFLRRYKESAEDNPLRAKIILIERENQTFRLPL